MGLIITKLYPHSDLSLLSLQWRCHTWHYCFMSCWWCYCQCWTGCWWWDPIIGSSYEPNWGVSAAPVSHQVSVYPGHYSGHSALATHCDPGCWPQRSQFSHQWTQFTLLQTLLLVTKQSSSLASLMTQHFVDQSFYQLLTIDDCVVAASVLGTLLIWSSVSMYHCWLVFMKSWLLLSNLPPHLTQSSGAAPDQWLRLRHWHSSESRSSLSHLLFLSDYTGSSPHLYSASSAPLNYII